MCGPQGAARGLTDIDVSFRHIGAGSVGLASNRCVDLVLDCHTMWLQSLLRCSYMEGGKMEVGIRELKNHLSQYLAVISEGGEVVVTDRGRAVARITAIETERTIDRLIASGVVTPARLAKRRVSSSRIRARKPVSPLVLEQRR